LDAPEIATSLLLTFTSLAELKLLTQQSFEEFRTRVKINQMISGKITQYATYQALKKFVDDFMIITTNNNATSQNYSDGNDELKRKSRFQPYSATRIPSVVIGPHRFSPVITLEFSKDGKFLYSGGRDTKIGVWKIPSGEHVCWIEEITKPAPTLTVCCISASPCGRFLASGGRDVNQDGEILIWRINSDSFFCLNFFSDDSYVTPDYIQFNAAGTLLACHSSRNTISFHHADSNEKWHIMHRLSTNGVRIFRGFVQLEESKPEVVLWYSRGFGASLRGIFMWDVNGEPQRWTNEPKLPINEYLRDFIFLPKYGMIMCTGHTMMLSNLSGEVLATAKFSHEQNPNILKGFDNLLVSATSYGDISIWSLPDLVLINSLRGWKEISFSRDTVYTSDIGLSIHPSGRWFAFGGSHNNCISLWEDV
jgi:WD40 repeat protein